MIRGIERREIFRDDDDRRNFLERLIRLTQELGFRCLAYALMPNHAHLVLQTGPTPLCRLMARLCTGYAVQFNRKYKRVGHVFQYRFRSRRVDDEGGLAAVIAYVERNPLAGGLVTSEQQLAGFEWCTFGKRAPEASGGSPPRIASDRREVGDPPVPRWAGPPRLKRLNDPFETLARRRCTEAGIDPSLLSAPGRARVVSRVRAAVAYAAVRDLAMSTADVARRLCVTPAAVAQMVARARLERAKLSILKERPRF